MTRGLEEGHGRKESLYLNEVRERERMGGKVEGGQIACMVE